MDSGVEGATIRDLREAKFRERSGSSARFDEGVLRCCSHVISTCPAIEAARSFDNKAAKVLQEELLTAGKHRQRDHLVKSTTMNL